MEREGDVLLNTISTIGGPVMMHMTNFFAPPKDKREMTISQLSNWLRWSLLVLEFSKENPGDEIQ